MRELTKAQIAVGILACFAIGLGSIQKVINSTNIFVSLGDFALQLIAVFILSFVILTILKWINLFDLKTDSIITLIVLITAMILYNL